MNKNSSIAVIGGGVTAVIIAVAVATVMFSGISNEQESVDSLVDDKNENSVGLQDSKIRVFASFYPYYEFTRNVAGDFATVEQYLPSGVEAHDWEPRAQEIQSLKDADVFVYNGLGMEPYVDNIIDSGEFDNVLFVKASEDIELMEHHDFEFDPHTWLDPVLAKQQVNNIRDGLIKADPQNKEHYEDNAKAYNEQLDELDMKIKSSLSSCNKDTFVPFHNAFSYLAERYDLKIMALSGITPDAEASAAEIAEFVDFVKDNDIKVIFYEEILDPRLAEVIADEAGAEVLKLSPVAVLTPEEIGKNITYLDKMEQNIDALKIALECQ